MKDVVIASAARTAIGAFGGALKETPAVELGGIVIKEVLRRAKVRQDNVDLVIMGNVLQAGEGQNPARQAALLADISQYTPALTVNAVCGSGMEAVITASQKIQTGAAEIVVAGGMECMSNAPFVLPQARWGARMGHVQVLDTMIHDGLWCSFGEPTWASPRRMWPNVSISAGKNRTNLRPKASRKPRRLSESGRFKDEIVPVEIPQRKGDPIIFDTDEFPRFGSTAEKLGKLKPAFAKQGTITAGNSAVLMTGPRRSWS